MLQYWRLLYVLEIICFEVVSCQHNDPLAGHFGIDKTWELVGRNHYWLSLRKDVEIYVQGYDICLTLKAVKYKPYSNLQSLLIPIYGWKDFFIDFVTRLPLSADWKGDSCNSILVIVNSLTKMVHYEPVKIIINALGLAEVIINMVI